MQCVELLACTLVRSPWLLQSDRAAQQVVTLSSEVLARERVVHVVVGPRLLHVHLNGGQSGSLFSLAREFPRENQLLQLKKLLTSLHSERG